MIETAVQSEIVKLEKQRCDALMAGDATALDKLLAADLIHIHGTGEVDDKDAYLRGVCEKFVFHDVKRGALKIRLYGDVAVVVGPLRQTISIDGTRGTHDISAMVTQIWKLCEGEWRQTTCHNSFLSMT